MKRLINFKVILIGSACLFLCITFNACYETAIPNITNPTRSFSTVIGNPLRSTSMKITNSICNTLQRCHPEVTYDSCSSQILKNAINMQIGAATTFSELAAVYRAEQSGSIKPNITSADTCAVAIEQLSCDDPLVLAAYNSNLKQPFSGSNNLIPLNASCSKIFSDNVITEAKNYHYIRSGAQGLGDGSNWENACPDFTGACSGSSMIRGDTYFVASGNYNSVSFDAPGDAVITVTKATALDHGTSQGWNDSYANGPAVFPSWDFSSSHWVLNGNGFSSPTSGHGFQINLPLLSSDCPKEFCNAIYLNRNTNLDDIRIRYTEIVGFGNSGQRNVTGIYSGPGNANASNISYSYGYMHDFGDGGVSFLVAGQGIQAWTFEYSHIERIQGEVLADQGSQNITVRYNTFKDVGRTAVIVSENTGANVVETKNMAIYGNIFWESDPSQYGTSNGIAACNDGNICSNWLFANNTIANFKSPGSLSARIRFDQASELSQGNRVVDNIWYDSIEVDSSTDLLASDYNNFILTTGTPTEPNSEVGSVDPFIHSDLGDFHLKAPTNSGVSLPSPFDFDLEGKLRGQNGIWNRGAYQ
ncbi:MAG: hypothetical protein ACXVCP_14760 [Bdellovibrio sp.]